MWTRAEIKERAKKVLKGNYWKAFLVSLIIVITGGSHNGGGSGGGGASGASSTGVDAYVNHHIVIIVSVIILLIILLRVFVGYALQVGGRKFFIKLSEGDSDLGYLGYGFRKDRYLNIIISMLLRSIYLFLWFLLLIIPGIVKSYAYRMVPYILADNPEIGHSRAIALSNEMTKGEKWDIFVLDLSFIGWYILGVLVLGVGVFFVQPYYDATNAELYLKIRQKAIVNGLTTNSELKIR